MKISKKVLISVLIIFVILTTNSIMLLNSVKAANISEISQIELHDRGTCGQLLKYKGVIVKTTYVEYTYNGKKYPAYCLDKTLPGITSELVYSVGTNKKIDDLGLWRTVVNGYPYKSIEELGVANEEEAFTATKHAIYCYLFENETSDYEAIGEAGQRTLNALNMIANNASNSKESQSLNTANIKSEDEEWIEDIIDSNYVSKVYSIDSIVEHLNYEVTIEKDWPEGSKITNLNGEETRSFTKGEKFKILLLKEKLINDGKLTISVNTEVKTKPVIYGASPNTSWQNYALTGYMYEDAKAKLEDTYRKIEKPEEQKNPRESITYEKVKIIEQNKILPVTGM